MSYVWAISIKDFAEHPTRSLNLLIQTKKARIIDAEKEVRNCKDFIDFCDDNGGSVIIGIELMGWSAN